MFSGTFCRQKYALVLLLTAMLNSACGKLWSNVRFDVNPQASLTTPSNLVVQPIYPINGARWNDYVTWTNKGGAGTVFNQPDTPCAGTELGYFSCIHGGEKLYVQVPSQTSCSNLTAEDSIGAFDWICQAQSGVVTFYSRGLRKGKGLRDLVSASAFIPNQITVYKNSTVIDTSPLAAWWSNTVLPLPVNRNSTDSATALVGGGNIYTLSSTDVTSGYSFSGVNNISIVTLGSSSLGYSGSTATPCAGGVAQAIICSALTNFLWMEVNVDGTNLNSADLGFGFSGQTDAFIRTRNSTFFGNPAFSGYRTNTNFSMLVDYSTFNHNSTGSTFTDTRNSIWMYDVGNDNFNSGNGQGFNLTNGCNNNVLYEITALGDSHESILYGDQGALVTGNNFINVSTGASFNYGLNIVDTSSGNNVSRSNFINFTSAQNQVSGIYMEYSQKGTWANLALLSNNTDGVQVQTSTVTENFQNVMAAYNGTGILLNSGADSQFTGSIWVNANSTMDCNGNGATNLSGAAAPSCFYGPGQATPAITTQDPANSYVGILGAKDNTNGTSQDALGEASYASITDWLNFSSGYRFWALRGTQGQFNAALQQGPCQNGICQIEDLRLRSNDTIMRNHYGAFVNGAACPASVNPNVAANLMTDQQTTVHTFLLHATEVMDPSLNPTGNYNGLCEAGEACIYSPNIGGYQGEGDYTTQTCIFNSGNGFTGNVMYAYPQNGN